MNAYMFETLKDVAEAAQQAGHGRKSAIYQAAADQLNISIQTLHRYLKDAGYKPPRKRRADAGKNTLSLDHARLISAYMMNSYRNNGKQLAGLPLTLEVLRSNFPELAARVDPDTGEIKYLSETAVRNALYRYQLHPKQLLRPAPKIPLSSLHPNHVWQIDPSLCVLFYLPLKKGEVMQVMDEKQFYKNKPANIRRIEKERVWRYVITDHASGWIFVHYVLGAESGKNLVDSFIAATQKRHSEDPVHGIPHMVMVDPGSANTGSVFTNLCRLLGVRVLVNKPGQPWAKGQVENANNIVERNFESLLKTMDPAPSSLDELNEMSEKWMRWYNQTAIHTRTKETRYQSWSRINQEQLVIAPPAKIMKELAFTKPVTRKVSIHLTVSFEGKVFSVKDVPNVMVGETILIAKNPWRQDNAAQVFYQDDEGREVIQVLEAMLYDSYGFHAESPVIGTNYKAMPDTVLDANRRHVERIVMGAATDDEAEQSRKAKNVPFSGQINPMKHIEDKTLVDYLPKRGTESNVVVPIIEQPKMSITQVAMTIKRQMGHAWQPAYMRWLEQNHPEGALEDDVAAIAEQIKQLPCVSNFK